MNILINIIRLKKFITKKISTLKNLSPTILHLHDIEIKNSTINSEIIGNTSVDKLPPILKRNTFNGRKHISLKNKKYKNSKILVLTQFIIFI